MCWDRAVGKDARQRARVLTESSSAHDKELALPKLCEVSS